MGKTESTVFNLIKENGFILSRYKNNYVAFTFGERRLNRIERTSNPVDETEFDIVVEYEVCAGSESFF